MVWYTHDERQLIAWQILLMQMGHLAVDKVVSITHTRDRADNM